MSLASRLTSSPRVAYGLSAGTLVAAASALYVLRKRRAGDGAGSDDVGGTAFGGAANTTPVLGSAAEMPKIVTRGRAAVNEESTVQAPTTPRRVHSSQQQPLPAPASRLSAAGRGGLHSTTSRAVPLSAFGVKIASVEQPALFAAFVALVVVLTLGVVGVASSGALSLLKPLLWVALGAIAAAVCVAFDRGSPGRSTSRVTIAPADANSRPAVALAPAAAPPTAVPASSQPAPSAASMSAPQLDASAFLVAGKPSAFDFHSRSDDLDWYPQDGVTESSWSDSDSGSDSGSDAGGDDVSEGGDDEGARRSSSRRRARKADGQESGGKAAEEKGSEAEATIARVDALHKQRDFQQVEQVLKSALGRPGLSQHHTCELAWRLSRNYGALCFDIDQKRASGDKEPLAKEAAQWADKALAADPNSAAAHKWIAISYGRLGGPTKEVIKRAYVIRDHALQSIKLDPTDGTILYVLGYFEYSVASMGFATRAVASALFGSPPKGSYAQALEHFMSAERTDPGFYMANRLMIAKTHLAMGNKDQARHWLQEALKLPLTPDEAKEDFDEAHKLCKKLGVRA